MKSSSKEKKSITVEMLYNETRKQLNLKLVSERGSFKKRIYESGIHRPGLALAGFFDLFAYQRVQICGDTEIAFLRKMTEEQRIECLHRVFSYDIPCILVTKTKTLPKDFIHIANEHQISVFRTSYPTTRVFQILRYYLDEKFAPSVLIHGSLVDVYGVGTLITGRSGIGKSEVALDLVARGHRLVADDVVTVVRRAGGVLVGRGNEPIRNHMEIRGLGIIDIELLFGIRGVRAQKIIEVQLELVDWDDSENYERLGITDVTNEILGEKLPLIRLPIFPGKNISVIAEVVALNQLLKLHGYHTAKKFESQLTKTMNERIQEMKEFLDYDFE
jgi:HPr kinase/phosphorylase